MALNPAPRAAVHSRNFDLFAPPDHVRKAILGQVRRESMTLSDPELGDVTVRDQGREVPVRMSHARNDCPGIPRRAQQPRVLLDDRGRLHRLLGAKRYRDQHQTVLRFDTGEILEVYADRIELAPLNTGSMHVPNAPQRGADVFVALADYPHEAWRARRGPRGDASSNSPSRTRSRTPQALSHKSIGRTRGRLYRRCIAGNGHR